MQTPVRNVSDLFMGLDLPELQAVEAGVGRASAGRLRVNSHIHLPPNFSAFDTVAEAVDLAADQGVAVLGASNYYDYHVYSEFAERTAGRGVFPLFGIEIIALLDDLVREGVKINDPGNPGKMYICGKGIARFEPMDSGAAELLDVIRAKDSERMARMTDRLAERFAAAGLETGLDEEAVKAQVVARHGSPKETVYLQERHVAQAFQEALFALAPPAGRAEALSRVLGAVAKAPDDAASVQTDIRSHMMKAGKPGYVEETFVGFDHAYRLILALGGIPCYPTLADGASTYCPFETPVEELIGRIKSRGICCTEFIPVRNSPEALERYVEGIRGAGFVVTAGTEHNTRDMLPIEPTCVDGQPIPDGIKDIFWEGACVVAAHQVLTLRGETGFVDSEGRPNPAFASAEERIAAFSALGDALIRQFRSRHAARTEG
jgi:hypothetical protein